MMTSAITRFKSRFERLFRDHGDQEFRPLALEILEKPPSPVALSMMGTIAALLVLAFLWSVLSSVDIVAIAPGKLQPSGRVKTVQSFETARVASIHVQNGDRVKKDDILIIMDDRDARAEYETAQLFYWSYWAESIRRSQLIEVIEGSGNLSILWPADAQTYIPDAIRVREEAVFHSDLEQLNTAIAALDASIRQKSAERRRIESTIASQEILIDVLDERVELRRKLNETAVGTRTSLIDALESLRQQEASLASLKGQALETDEARLQLAAEQKKLIKSAIADNQTKLVAARQQAEESKIRLSRADLRMKSFIVGSPLDGIVQSLTLTSVGQVLGAGQEAMRIVPASYRLEAEVYAQNKDIGFIREGQEVMIKIEAFPFTRYGILKARVARIATDSVAQPEMLQADVDPSKPLDAKSGGSTQRVQNLVYPVVAILERSTISIDGGEVPLIPGMSVVAEIKTGKRRLIDFLLSPISETTSEAARER